MADVLSGLPGKDTVLDSAGFRKLLDQLPDDVKYDASKHEKVLEHARENSYWMGKAPFALPNLKSRAEAEADRAAVAPILAKQKFSGKRFDVSGGKGTGASYMAWGDKSEISKLLGSERRGMKQVADERRAGEQKAKDLKELAGRYSGGKYKDIKDADGVIGAMKGDLAKLLEEGDKLTGPVTMSGMWQEARKNYGFGGQGGQQDAKGGVRPKWGYRPIQLDGTGAPVAPVEPSYNGMSVHAASAARAQYNKERQVYRTVLRAYNANKEAETSAKVGWMLSADGRAAEAKARANAFLKNSNTNAVHSLITDIENIQKLTAAGFERKDGKWVNPNDAVGQPQSQPQQPQQPQVLPRATSSNLDAAADKVAKSITSGDGDNRPVTAAAPSAQAPVSQAPVDDRKKDPVTGGSVASETTAPVQGGMSIGVDRITLNDPDKPAKELTWEDIE